MYRLKPLAIILVILMLVPCFALAAPPEITAESAIMIDAESGQVLYDKNMHKQMYPASITKIMTTILAVEKLKLEDKIVMSAEAVEAVSRDASHIALTEGEEITVKEAVYSALLASANDACNGIAEKVSGTMDGFARLMTDKAKEIGCLGTNFTNSNGLKDENHYTTAYDMALITAYGLKNATWREMFGCRRYEMPPTNKQNSIRYLNNQHKMIFEKKDYYEGIIGGKTGYTTIAKNTLVTAAERDGVQLIVVVMKCPQGSDTYSDTKALLDYGFANYKKLVITKDDIPQKASNGTEVALENDVGVLVPVGTTEVEKKIRFENKKAYLIVENTSGDEIGKFPLTITSQTAVIDEEIEEEGGGLGIIVILLIILISIVALLALFIGFIYIRKEIYIRRRRRERREQRRKKL